jgi:type II secretory pathway pseudopilin PulG
MPDPIDDTQPDPPALIETVTRQRARLTRPIVLLLLILAGTGLWLALATRAARREADMLQAQAAALAAQESAAEDSAQNTNAAALSATLDSLAEHLPAALSLAAAEGRPGGGIRISIDTPDPDSLRAAFGGDPWFDRFRERAQEQHDDGSFRVVLERK